MDDEQNPEGDYYQRYRVCQAHLTLSVLLKQSVPQRFCQVPARCRSWFKCSAAPACPSGLLSTGALQARLTGSLVERSNAGASTISAPLTETGGAAPAPAAA